MVARVRANVVKGVTYWLKAFVLWKKILAAQVF
jgi:hypothetical protein